MNRLRPAMPTIVQASLRRPDRVFSNTGDFSFEGDSDAAPGRQNSCRIPAAMSSKERILSTIVLNGEMLMPFN
jgi:hypothetical protein